MTTTEFKVLILEHWNQLDDLGDKITSKQLLSFVEGYERVAKGIRRVCKRMHPKSENRRYLLKLIGDVQEIDPTEVTLELMNENTD